jgi:hypothetical protein
MTAVFRHPALVPPGIEPAPLPGGLPARHHRQPASSGIVHNPGLKLADIDFGATDYFIFMA